MELQLKYKGKDYAKIKEMVMKNGGMKIEEAMNIKPKDIADYLGGLPARKFHCSILADKAFKKAVENYRNKI